MKRKNLDSLLKRVEASQTNQNEESIVNINDALSKNLKKGGYATNNGHCHSGYNSSCGNSHCSGGSNGSCSNTSCLI